MGDNVETDNSVKEILKLAKNLYKSNRYTEALSIYVQESPLDISKIVNIDNELKFQRRYVVLFICSLCRLSIKISKFSYSYSYV